jgi:histidinol dehydrogenase
MPIRTFTNTAEGRAFILAHRELRDAELSPRMRDGVRRVFGADLSAEQAVARILADVRAEGDDALRRYTREFDGVELDALEV